MFKVFPVNRAVLRPFRGQISFPLFADINNTLPFTWNTTNPDILLNTFKQQLEENVYSFIEHNIQCGKYIENGTFNNTFFMGLSEEEALERCIKFTNPEVRKGYEDTFFKDTEVFAEDGGEKTSQVFAVVALSEDYVYQGHIYTWTTGTTCVAFGIRGRPDKAFTKKEQNSIANKLIGFILNKVGCLRIVVPNPLPVMKKILVEKHGFVFERVPVAEIGNTFVGYVPDNRPMVGACVHKAAAAAVGGTRRKIRMTKRTTTKTR